jgi:hypothetical protein
MGISRLPAPGAGIPTSTVTAKGDLIAGTANNAVSRLGVGANGTTLVADSSEATGLKWATASGGGKVLQVVQGTYQTAVAITSTTNTDTGLSASITPSSVSSKILVIATLDPYYSSDSTYCGGVIRLMRGATSIYASTNTTGALHMNNTTTSVPRIGGLQTLTYLDSPATTSSTTYKTQARIYQATNNMEVGFNSYPNVILLLEIGA